MFAGIACAQQNRARSAPINVHITTSPAIPANIEIVKGSLTFTDNDGNNAIDANVSFAQEANTVTLTVSGQGKTQDDAKQNALRNAIEQAFGTFISSNTEILNDELVKDEIVSIANGNIQKFEVISEVEVPEAGHATTLKVTVSVTKGRL